MAPPYGIALNVEAADPGRPMEKPLAPISPLGSSPGEVHGGTWHGAGAILFWKDERVADVVSWGLRFLPAPCRGTVCTFDLARLPHFRTCQACARVRPTRIDIYVRAVT
jgi:hypothetical protein